MKCESCSADMIRVYDVIERETMFVLWECACGQKLLERQPAERAAMVGATAQD